MANFRTSYIVTHTAPATVNGTVHLVENGKGGVDVVINSQKALTLTSTGYLRRHAVTSGVGFRLLDNGKIAMKADDGSSN